MLTSSRQEIDSDEFPLPLLLVVDRLLGLGLLELSDNTDFVGTLEYSFLEDEIRFAADASLDFFENIIYIRDNARRTLIDA